MPLLWVVNRGITLILGAFEIDTYVVGETKCYITDFIW